MRSHLLREQEIIKRKIFNQTEHLMMHHSSAPEEKDTTPQAGGPLRFLYKNQGLAEVMVEAV